MVRFVDGVKTYILTTIDVEHRFGYAHAYQTHSSKSAADFLEKLKCVAPMLITTIQTDSGSEFAYLFDDYCTKHHYTYPRSPKMNAFVECFNRTL